MKKINILLTKEVLENVRDDINFILFNIKGIGLKELQTVNNIIGGLENAKININLN